MLNSLKSHAHYFTVFIYLETWRGAKLGIYTHFTFTNSPWCSQSMNSLIYVYSMQIPRWSQMWSPHFFVPPPLKKFFVLPSDGSSFLSLEFPPTSAEFPLQGSRNLLEDQEKSGKFDVFWEKSEKSKGRKFLSMQVFNF